MITLAALDEIRALSSEALTARGECWFTHTQGSCYACQTLAARLRRIADEAVLEWIAQGCREVEG